MTHLDVKTMDDGAYYILEDNAKGFFRIAENTDNLRNNYVFVQAKDGQIYQIMELFRKETDSELKSTVRYFYPISIDTDVQFVKKIENDEYRKQREQMMQIVKEALSELNNCSDLFSLWRPGLKYMIVYNMITSIPIIIFENPYKRGEMETSRFSIPPTIICRYMISKNNKLIPEKRTYLLRIDDAKKPIWKLLAAQ